MNWLHDFEDELTAVFAEAERRLASFPSPLNEAGERYLNAFHPLRRESTKNYICYLLPYWLLGLAGEAESAKTACRRMAVANVFVMLHFFLLDDVMDEPGEGGKEKLALASLMQTQYMDVYVSLFRADSPFWTLYRQYVSEWAAGVSGERPDGDLFGDPVRIAHKASPVKLASSGLLLLAGQGESIGPVSEAIDQVLVSLQMADDRADWREDLRLGNANCLLALVRKERGETNGRELTEKDVKAAIYVSGCLERYAEIAAERHRRLLKAKPAVPHLLAFHGHLADALARDAAAVVKERWALLAGGFSYMLSKYAK
ncbi:hypothetical protein [Paenibacillus sp. GYB003]|uniref:hypothetical protein n=1 Tax=Paenibacillus sp. GYB003 TaxID=2994392 RepID=UPI002F96B81E